MTRVHLPDTGRWVNLDLAYLIDVTTSGTVILYYAGDILSLTGGDARSVLDRLAAESAS